MGCLTQFAPCHGLHHIRRHALVQDMSAAEVIYKMQFQEQALKNLGADVSGVRMLQGACVVVALVRN
jgi:hypothetical protein